MSTIAVPIENDRALPLPSSIRNQIGTSVPAVHCVIAVTTPNYADQVSFTRSAPMPTRSGTAPPSVECPMVARLVISMSSDRTG